MKEEIKSTYKSDDTEEWLDRVWTRPIGYAWALLFRRLRVHPNTVTVLSMIIGAASAFFFAHGSYRTEGWSGLGYNLVAILLLAWANFYDSADGQLARMTGQKTRLGRILDGVHPHLLGAGLSFLHASRVGVPLARHRRYPDERPARHGGAFLRHALLRFRMPQPAVRPGGLLPANPPLLPERRGGERAGQLRPAAADLPTSAIPPGRRRARRGSSG